MAVRGLLVCAMLVALAGAGAETGAGQDVPRRPDFSGNWEKDFARSDMWELELRRAIYQLNQQAQVQQRRGDGGPITIDNSRRRIDGLVVNARLAELISRQTGMDIVQTADDVLIERDGDAPLICRIADSPDETFASVHGRESCGWDRGQLVFEITLADGAAIRHRFSVDSGREQMRVQTTVAGRNSMPFSLVQYFNRYDARTGGFECVQTLTRGRVCSTNTSGE